MATIKPFRAIRPANEYAAQVAALPYDVVDRQEARVILENNPLSFLAIDRADATLDDTVDIYDPTVYQTAYEHYQSFLNNQILLKDQTENLYLYELTMQGRTQTGIVCCAAVDDYLNDTIKKHEKTRQDKEEDRIRHVDVLDANTGPIFLANKSSVAVKEIMLNIKKREPDISFFSGDQIRHQIWTISDQNLIAKIVKTYENIEALYIADGHHRCASAVAVAEKRRKEFPNAPSNAEFNYFLAVIFDQSELKIYDYNRLIQDLNGYTKKDFLKKVSEKFELISFGKDFQAPKEKATFSMYLNHEWYLLKARRAVKRIELANDVIGNLDVSILQNDLLQPILNIQDPRTDQRIDFVGGIRGYQELERRVDCGEMKIAFRLFPTTMDELFAVADQNLLMPPKSTWFEPKLRSGLFIHDLETRKFNESR